MAFIYQDVCVAKIKAAVLKNFDVNNSADILQNSGLFDHIGDDIKQELVENLDEDELRGFIYDKIYFSGEEFLNLDICKDIRESITTAVSNLQHDIYSAHKPSLKVEILRRFGDYHNEIVETADLSYELVFRYAVKCLDETVTKKGFNTDMAIISNITNEYIQLYPCYIIAVPGVIFTAREDNRTEW